jgi:cobyrinic acid a,c-diamide synthase
MKYAFLIAAPHSGSGKTTLARGLMALFTQQSLRVQPFKCGPDYIDTKFHEEVCQRPSINLDTFMATEEHVRDLFGRYTQGGDEAPAWAREPADMAIVEGMMGLFDGYDHDRGSCGEIARMLALPIVLVVDARSAAYSMAALLQGFIRFRAGMRFAGVIFNKVGSPRHEAMLREVADEVGIACLGCIPRQAALEQASRYLGLDFSERTFINKITATLSAHIDCKRLLEESRLRPSENEHRSVVNATETTSPATYRSILVARNAESFSFIYQETLDLLHQLGEVEFFDPEERTNDERRMTNDELRMTNYELGEATEVIDNRN